MSLKKSNLTVLTIDNKKYVSRADLARFLGTSRKTIENYMDKNNMKDMVILPKKFGSGRLACYIGLETAKNIIKYFKPNTNIDKLFENTQNNIEKNINNKNNEEQEILEFLNQNKATEELFSDLNDDDINIELIKEKNKKSKKRRKTKIKKDNATKKQTPYYALNDSLKTLKEQSEQMLFIVKQLSEKVDLLEKTIKNKTTETDIQEKEKKTINEIDYQQFLEVVHEYCDLIEKYVNKYYTFLETVSITQFLEKTEPSVANALKPKTDLIQSEISCILDELKDVKEKIQNYCGNSLEINIFIKVINKIVLLIIELYSKFVLLKILDK